MARRSRDFDQFLRQSLGAAAASVPVGEDGLDSIWIRLAQARSSHAAEDAQGVRRAGTAGDPVPECKDLRPRLGPGTRPLLRTYQPMTGRSARSTGR
jgi:hypothetical protein